MKEFMSLRNIHTFEELIKFMKVADNCTLCIPYIRKMTETGETEFGLITDSSDTEIKKSEIRNIKTSAGAKN